MPCSQLTESRPDLFPLESTRPKETFRLLDRLSITLKELPTSPPLSKKLNRDSMPDLLSLLAGINPNKPIATLDFSDLNLK